MLEDLAEAAASYLGAGLAYALWCIPAWERDRRWMRRRGKIPLMRAAVMLAVFAWPAFLARRGASRHDDPATEALPLRRHQPDYDKIEDLERQIGRLTYAIVA
jgi:hypothetical protein